MDEVNQLIANLEKQKRLEKEKKRTEKRQERLDQKRMLKEVKPVDATLRRVYKFKGYGITFGIYEYDYHYTLTYEGVDEKRQKKANFLIYEWRDSHIWGFLHRKLQVYSDWDLHKDKILPALTKALKERT